MSYSLDRATGAVPCVYICIPRELSLAARFFLLVGCSHIDGATRSKSSYPLQTGYQCPSKWRAGTQTISGRLDETCQKHSKQPSARSIAWEEPRIASYIWKGTKLRTRLKLLNKTGGYWHNVMYVSAIRIRLGTSIQASTRDYIAESHEGKATSSK